MTNCSATTAPAKGPLNGLTVIDLTQVVSGAVTTMFLSDFGANVIKIEPPHGEAYRVSGYPIARDADETNLNILRFSRDKRSVVLDLKSAAGRGVLAELVSRADILVENFRPGVLGRFGFTAEDLKKLNPGLIYTSVSGFGHDDIYASPYRDRPAYAIIVEAMAGLTHLAGNEDGLPVWMGFAMADIFAGVLAFSGTLLELLNQDRRGGRVDISMYDGAIFMNELAVICQTVLGEVMGRGHYSLQSPWGPYPTADGHVAIALINEKQWQALCALIGRTDLSADHRLTSGKGRSVLHHDVVEPAIAAWTSPRKTADCMALLLENDIPAGPVNTAEDVVNCPQVAARQMLIDVEDDVVGSFKIVGNPVVVGERAPVVGRIPRLGEHTTSVLKEMLDLDGAALQSLQERGAFGAHEVAAIEELTTR